jgi:hypothetical protein
VLTRDELLDDISLHGFTDPAASSARLYREHFPPTFAGPRIAARHGTARYPLERRMHSQATLCPAPVARKVGVERAATAAVAQRPPCSVFAHRPCRVLQGDFGHARFIHPPCLAPLARPRRIRCPRRRAAHLDERRGRLDPRTVARGALGPDRRAGHGAADAGLRVADRQRAEVGRAISGGAPASTPWKPLPSKFFERTLPLVEESCAFAFRRAALDQ